MAERAFSVALLFCLLWLAVAFLWDFVVIPEWNNINIGFSSLAVSACVMNYFNEYLGKFPLSYSKFAAEGQINARLGWSVSYAVPAVVQIVLWYSVGLPSSTFHLVALLTYVGHFIKRVLEALFLHKYSKKWSLVPAVQVSAFYTLGSFLQHYWCNVYTDDNLAVKMSANHQAFVVGIVLYIIGELLNLYHHFLLACLRSVDSSSYFIPNAGLFRFVVCPHYCFELIAWYGMAVISQHLGVYLAWLTMVCYLAGRSHQTQQWYMKKIENFPKDRRNMFPGIY